MWIVHSAEVTANHNQTIRDVYRDCEAQHDELSLHHISEDAHGSCYTQAIANHEAAILKISSNYEFPAIRGCNKPQCGRRPFRNDPPARPSAFISKAALDTPFQSVFTSSPVVSRQEVAEESRDISFVEPHHSPKSW